MEYKTIPCMEEDEIFIQEKLEAINDSIAPPKEGAEDEILVFKIADDAGYIIAGCVLVIGNRKYADLDTLWVDERYRRQGLGSALIREAEKAARQRGCRTMVLGTFDFQAKPLYEKHGYTLCGVMRDWPRGHENNILMKKLDRYTDEYVPSNDLSAQFRVLPGDDEDGKAIDKKLSEYNASQVPCEQKYIPFNKKIVDGEGRIIAAVFADVGSWNEGDIDMIWVDEPYRNRGIASALLAETERELKENGAYVIFIDAYEWQSSLFRKHGYSECCTLVDFPVEGRRTYVLEKRFRQKL